MLLVGIVLSLFIEFLNTLELATAFLVFINSAWIADEVYIKLIPPRTDQDLTLRYEILTQTSRKFYKVPDMKKPFQNIVDKVIYGKVL